MCPDSFRGDYHRHLRHSPCQRRAGVHGRCKHECAGDALKLYTVLRLASFYQDACVKSPPGRLGCVALATSVQTFAISICTRRFAFRTAVVSRTCLPVRVSPCTNPLFSLLCGCYHIRWSWCWSDRSGRAPEALHAHASYNFTARGSRYIVREPSAVSPSMAALRRSQASARSPQHHGALLPSCLSGATAWSGRRR